jgi:hypothetical protein
MLKGARFLKKEKSGRWMTVRLSRCREKISQRLRERIPRIKLGQLKPRESKKPLTLTATQTKASAEPRMVSDVLPLSDTSLVAVTDASSDEEDMDEISFISIESEENDGFEADNITVGSSEHLLSRESFDFGIFECFEEATEQEPSKKRAADLKNIQSQQQRQKRRYYDDHNGYNYGIVYECCHDQKSESMEDNELIEAFPDIFLTIKEESSLAYDPMTYTADLDDDVDLLRYFLF